MPEALRTFIHIPPDSPFPVENLPYGVFRRRNESNPRVGVAIGAYVLDLGVLEHKGFFDELPAGKVPLFMQPSLNAFLEAGPAVWKQARRIIQELVTVDGSSLKEDIELLEQVLVPLNQAELLLPVEIGDYTDFYSSKEHATNVGTMFRGADKALMPNWSYLPVGYHGRSSSIVVSGTPIRRPWGQIKVEGADAPIFAPSRLLDFELEMGFIVGPGNALGEPIPIEKTPEHIFGMVIVNDWSARDIQKWEYVPLGPFLGKNFGTTISPWVVPMEALEPFRVPGPRQDPEPLPYLRMSGDQAFDIHLEVYLKTEKLAEPVRIVRSNFKYLYWSIYQQLAHHTSNGCNVRPGDLMASGTISGPTKDSYGSLLELTWKGTHPIELPDGSIRRFLEDGDTVIMTAWAEGPGYRVGFGTCEGTILPAR